MTASDKGDLVGDACMVADEIGHVDPALRIGFQESAIPVTEDRHVVGRAQERIVLRRARFVASQQVQPAGIDRRHVDGLQRVELPQPTPLRHIAEQGGYRDPTL